MINRGFPYTGRVLSLVLGLLCEVTQARLAEWHQRLLTDWAQTREELIRQLNACRQDDWAQKVERCERDQLVDPHQPSRSARVEHSVARLKRLDAALCQMDLGLYGFCPIVRSRCSPNSWNRIRPCNAARAARPATARDSTLTNPDGGTLCARHFPLPLSLPIMTNPWRDDPGNPEGSRTGMKKGVMDSFVLRTRHWASRWPTSS